MESPRKSKRSFERAPLRWILGGLIGTTLYFHTTLADPFNSPKLWILMISAAWLSGYIVSNRNLIGLNRNLRKFVFIILLFLLSLFASTVASDVKYIAIIGDTQRRNGFLQYLSLSILMIAAAMFIRIDNLNKLISTTFFIATASFFYSLLQTTGNDFVSWNNPYNSVISTLGNPNFAAAAMAIMGVLIFSSAMDSRFKSSHRVTAAILVLMLIFMIYRSNARQGLISFVIGAGVVITLFCWKLNKKLGLLVMFLGTGLSILSVLGMLQIGPLEKYLYKPSVSVRGYYWRAGYEMFINNPLFGVGIDRYGSYFKEYRDKNYPLNIGFEITSTNAHNTFIQFFATGGIFLGTLYLILNLFILYCATKGLKTFEGHQRLSLIGVFAAWVAYHSQSLISIDNVGISVWGWILGGAIVGLSLPLNGGKGNMKEVVQKDTGKQSLTQIFTSSLNTMAIFVLVLLLFRGESISYKGSESINLQDLASREYFKQLQLNVINTPLNDPSYKLYATSRLIQGGFSEGLVEVEKLNQYDPRNLDVLLISALTYEQLNDLPKAIKFRKAIIELDPWNAVNYLELGKYYKSQGNITDMEAMLNKILSFASEYPIALEAIREIGS